MQITITSTPVVTTIRGTRCRVWQGVTALGHACKVFVHALAVPDERPEAHEEFRRELAELPPPTLDVPPDLAVMAVAVTTPPPDSRPTRPPAEDPENRVHLEPTEAEVSSPPPEAPHRSVPADGRWVADAWQKYRATVVHPDAPADQVWQLRQAFYAAAWFVMSAVAETGDDAVTVEQAYRFLKGMRDEIEGVMEELSAESRADEAGRN